MKYTITIEHEPTFNFPYMAHYKELMGVGKTSKEAEENLFYQIKLSQEKQPTITKEIEI